jgi:CRISPR-associated exonuclease Cas4
MDELIQVEAPFRVTDLKQWIYCPRVLYYAMCLPQIRPITYKMEVGIEAGKSEEGREQRRSLRPYGLEEGRKAFDVELYSSRYGLRGKADLIVWIDNPPPGTFVVVDYKLSAVAGEHFKLQLMAYALMTEEMSGLTAKRGYLYLVPKRRSEKVQFTPHLREKLLLTLESMHHMLNLCLIQRQIETSVWHVSFAGFAMTSSKAGLANAAGFPAKCGLRQNHDIR